MRYFFIDTENIQNYDFIEELELNSEDKVIMMYSDKSKRIHISDLRRFVESKVMVEFESIVVGTKNALDFQLVTNLALYINQNTEDIYYIVSNDTGFEVAVDYLKSKRNVHIEILKVKGNNAEVELSVAADDFENDEQLSNIVMRSTNLCDLHNQLRDVYGNDAGRALYMKLKKNFKR